MIKRIICLCLSLFMLCSCFESKSNDNDEIVPVTRHVDEEIFGTDVSFTMYNSKSIKKIFPDVQRYLKKLYYLLDREHLYDEMNNLATININYGSGEEIVVDPLLYNALKLGVELTILTDGYFNIGAGALADTWQYYYYEEDGERYEGDRFSKLGLVSEDPSEENIDAALACTPSVDDYSNMLVFNDDTYGITFNAISSCTRGVMLTLGALGKGYAIEKTKEYVATLTDEVVFINAGSSSIVTSGINPLKERDTWNVALQSPYPFSFRSNTQYSLNIGVLGSMAISTSGDTEKYYFLDDGNDGYIVDEYGVTLKRHHIINPKTGYPMNYWNVITFVSSTRADILDALTTATYSLSSIEEVNDLIDVISEHYNIEIGYVLQRAKKNNDTDEYYVSTFISEDIQDDLISYKTYVVIENKKEEGE